MYRPVGGLANIFIHLSQIDDPAIPVYMKSKTISKYINFKNNFNFIYEDVSNVNSIPTYCCMNHYTRRNLHSKMKDRMEPADGLLKDEHLKLLEGVKLGLAIRTFKEAPKEWQNVPIEMYYRIIRDNDVNFFITSDSIEVKRAMKKEFGDRVTYVEGADVHTEYDNIDDPTPYLDFFLLSMCPTIAFTAGGVLNGSFAGFSTFGYMAAVYGGKPMALVEHDRVLGDIF